MYLVTSMILDDTTDWERGSYYVCYVCGKPARYVLRLEVSTKGKAKTEMPFWCCGKHCKTMQNRKTFIYDRDLLPETMEELI